VLAARGSNAGAPARGSLKTIADTDLAVAKLSGTLPADIVGDHEGRTPADNPAVRSVFIIRPDRQLVLGRSPIPGSSQCRRMTRLRGQVMQTTRVVVLGAGFGGLEVTTRLSERFGSEIDIVFIDTCDGFVFGYSKLDVMFGQALPASIYSRTPVTTLSANRRHAGRRRTPTPAPLEPGNACQPGSRRTSAGGQHRRQHRS